MPHSLQSTFATKPLCWHTCPSSGDDLECDTDLYSHYLATGNLWPPPALAISDTFPDMQDEMKFYGHYPIHLNFACMHVAVHARSTAAPCLLLLANAGQLMPHPPVVATSCSNPHAHKAKVHYQRGTLVESRPCWQVVPFPSQSPAFPSTSPS